MTAMSEIRVRSASDECQFFAGTAKPGGLFHKYHLILAYIGDLAFSDKDRLPIADAERVQIAARSNCSRLWRLRWIP
jgi:hypothetical protein